MILLLIIAFAILIPIDLPGLIRKKHWRELAVFSVLILIGFSICLLQILDIQVPNPVRDTQYFVKNLFPFGYD